MALKQNMILTPGSSAEGNQILLEHLEFQPCATSEVRPEAYADIDTRQLIWDQVIQSLQTTLLFDFD